MNNKLGAYYLMQTFKNDIPKEDQSLMTEEEKLKLLEKKVPWYETDDPTHFNADIFTIEYDED